MKQLLLILIFVVQSMCCIGQTYQIQDNIITIILSKDNVYNENQIDLLLRDSTLNKNCINMIISGESKILPRNLYRMDWVENMQINIDDTIFIDNNFSKFKSLENLLIFGGYVKMDDNINLESICYLKIQYTKFINGKFPSVICNWINLKEVIITDSNLRWIPKNINRLSDLEILGLSNNKIEDIPNELFYLEKLRNLSLYGNSKLKTISARICSMKNLRYIHLDVNIGLDDRIKDCLNARVIRFDKYGQPYDD